MPPHSIHNNYMGEGGWQKKIMPYIKLLLYAVAKLIRLFAENLKL